MATRHSRSSSDSFNRSVKRRSPMPCWSTPRRTPRKIALVDGKRVLIEGRDEIVLRCCKATLTLRRDGQILLKGVNIRTEAEEVQRIKGGKVQIN